jgi:hypothetical protein
MNNAMRNVTEQEAKISDSTQALETEASLEDIFRAAPALRLVLRGVLELCKIPRTNPEVDSEIEKLLSSQLTVFAPTTLRGWLEQAGALEPVTLESGQGAWKTTVSGFDYLDKTDLYKELQAVIDSDPERRSLFLELLNFCQSPRDKEEIEERLYAGQFLSKGSVPYPTAFIGAMEESGAMQWNGQWITTEIGKALCSNIK